MKVRSVGVGVVCGYMDTALRFTTWLFFSSNVESFKRDETAGEGAAAGRQEPGS
jgi:hypothetical protein